MVKFCTSCGTQLSDGETNCSSCGALTGSQVEQVSQETAAPTATYEIPEGNTGVAANKTPTTTYIGMAVVGVIAIIIIALFASLFGGGAYTKPIDRMVKGMMKEDSDKYLSAFPEFVADRMEDSSYQDIDDMLEDLMDDMKDEYGKNVKITYKVTDKEKLDKDDLKDWKKTIKSRYNEKVDVTKGYELEVEMKIKGKEDSDEEETDFTVLKIDGKWYLMGGLF